MFTAVFAALVLLNYAIQTTFVPAMARSATAANAPAIAAFSMANPESLGWSLEMWGYAWLGVATWLIAPVLLTASSLERRRLARATVFVFRANAVVSLGGALWTAADPGWVLRPEGYAALALWNVLVAAMAVLAYSLLKNSAAAR